MRIGLNLLYLLPGVVAGTETYARGLLSGLKQLDTDHEFVLFLNRETSDADFDLGSRFRTVVCPVNATNRRARYSFEQLKLRAYVQNERIDILHSLGYTSPLFHTIPTVVTVHDLNFRAFGGSMPVVKRMMLRFFVGQSVLRSDKVIAVSEFSRQEILNVYRVNGDKVVAIHEAFDPAAFSETSARTARQYESAESHLAPYIVAFSNTYVNKNIGRLIEAFVEAKRSGKIDHKLVLIGHRYPVERQVGVNLSADGMADVSWTGYVDREEVIRVLRGAEFMVFPSYYEGFGLPVLEAMAAGVPVLCSRAASLPEVAGDAALYFDPFSVKNIAECIITAAGNPGLKRELRSKGYENLKRFSWTKTAAETVKVYCDVMRQSGKTTLAAA